jgi:hypothetical protein
MIMKTKVVTMILFLFISVGTAQECNSYYPLTEGLTAQVTSYDKKGKTTATVDYAIVDVRVDNGLKIAKISSAVKDEKGNLIATTNYNVTCNGDVVSIDFKSLMSPQLIDEYKKLDFEITGTNIEIPNKLNVGDKLPDSNMEMIMKMSGMNMKMNVAMKDRKVTGQEKITSPAGSFDCYIITYTSEFNMGIIKRATTKQWLSQGVGMVKQEDYNENGKLTSISMLTAFSK